MVSYRLFHSFEGDVGISYYVSSYVLGKCICVRIELYVCMNAHTSVFVLFIKKRIKLLRRLFA